MRQVFQHAKTRLRIPIFSILVFLGTQCSENSAEFRSTIDSGKQKPPRNEDLQLSPDIYRFQLKVADGAPFVRQGRTPSLTEIFTQDNNTPLTPKAAEAWDVKIKIGEEEELPKSAIGSTELDLSLLQGHVNIQAHFLRNSDSMEGYSQQNIFVDGIAPRLSLAEIDTSPTGDTRTVFWMAMDNLLLNNDRSVMYACTEDDPQHYVENLADLKNLLTGNCAEVLSGSKLLAQGDRIQLGAIRIQGTDYTPGKLQHYLYAEDAVGNGGSVTMTPAARVGAILNLDALPSQIQFTNKALFNANLSLTHLERGQLDRIDADINLWPQYSLDINRTPLNQMNSVPFNRQVELELGQTEGLYTFTLSAIRKDTALKSNLKTIPVIFDKTPVKISEILIQNGSGALDPSSRVTVSWNAQDLNGITKQNLEIQLKDSTEWIAIASDLSGTVRSFTFPWGNRPTSGFTARIQATDPADNTGMEQSHPWRPQIFNAAVLTSSVQCLYCHMKIEGDVAGINFSTNPHADTGENLQIFGKLFATNASPQKQKAAVVGGAADQFDNYKNTGLKIFPDSIIANPLSEFPRLDMNILLQRMNGTIIDGQTRQRYSRFFDGNLILIGTVDSPIQLNGEFAVTGDLIIKGYYKGIGSVYARNVFVTNDLVSIDCLPNSTACPFPFSGPTEAEKLDQAKLAIKNKQSALYLAGLVQMNVGAISTNWAETLPQPVSHPYNWLTQRNASGQITQTGQTRFESFCQPATEISVIVGGISRFLRVAIGDGFHYKADGSSDVRAKCEVSRVDAYLYGHDRIAWRAYNNILLNGGFMAYQAAILSTVPFRYFRTSVNPKPAAPLNPRNGLSVNQNVIRYDWRLRAGGPGFESLKALFD